MSDTGNKDKDLENYLKGSSSISRLYQKTVVIEPSQDTEDAILAAARRAVDSKPKPVSPFGYRWMVPTSLAAVLVLTVSIIVLQPPSLESTGKTDAILEGNERFDFSEQRAKKKERQEKSVNVEQLQKRRLPQEQEEVSDKLTDQQAKPAVTKEQIAAAPRLAMEPQPTPAANDAMVQTESAPVGGSKMTRSEEKKTIIADSGQKQRTEADDMKSADVAGRFSSAATMAPEKWLDKIQKMLVEKKTDEATREYKLFKKTFPDYQIDYSRYTKLKEIEDIITQ